MLNGEKSNGKNLQKKTKIKLKRNQYKLHKLAQYHIIYIF